MAHSVDHQPSCPGRRVIGYRCFGCRCRSSYSQQRSVPSHDADPDRCRNSHLVPRASTTQTRLRHSQNQNVYGTDKSHCSASVISAKGPRAPSVRDAVRGYPYLLVVAQSKWQRPIICLPFVGNPYLARLGKSSPLFVQHPTTRPVHCYREKDFAIVMSHSDVVALTGDSTVWPQIFRVAIGHTWCDTGLL